MSKWHINKHGVPSPCQAKSGNCPLGGDESHYESESQASKAVNERFESEYGLLPNSKLSVQRKKDISKLIKRVSGIRSPGFEHECFASLSVAEDLGLDRITVTDESGLIVNMSMTDNGQEQINTKLFVDRSVEGLSDYYEKMGVSIKNKSALARVIYHSEDPEKNILVQSGGPNVLDAAIIKADKVVDIIEVKELGKGAQMPSISLEIKKDGSISEKSLDKQSPYMKTALSNMSIQDADGKDVQVNFGSEENNKKMPLYHFVEQYRSKGATSFIYMTNDGKTVNKVSLVGPVDETVQRLMDHKIEANVTLRANLNKQKVTEDDIHRFNSILSKGYSKSGRSSNTEAFTLKGIKEDKITKSGEYVRVGGFILPIKYDNYKENLHKRINKKDMKAFKLVLAGNIKTNY